MRLSTLLSFTTLGSLAAAQGFGNSTIFPLSTDSQFSFSLQVVLAQSDGYGSNPSEVLTAAANITASDFESYYEAFNYLGTRIYNISQQINSTKFAVSAREALFRSASYFRASVTYLYGNVTDPRLYSLWDQQATAFDAAIALLPVPGYRVNITGPGFSVPIIFYPASNDGVERPTALAGTGYDGSQEDLLHTLGFEILSRGYNFVTYEGPGQPTPRRDQQLGFIPQWENVVTPVVDYLVSHPKVDADAMALVGVSFGGQLAPIVAAHEHRFAAVLLYDGLWSIFEQLEVEWPSQLIELYNNSQVQEFDEAVLAVAANASYPTDFRWFIQQGLWSFKTSSPYNLLQQLSQYTLTTELLQNITCPVFVGMGLDDASSVSAPQVAEAIGDKATLFRFVSDIGAGEHCQVGAESYLASVTMDWFQGVLDDRNAARFAGNFTSVPSIKGRARGL
ncbi:20-hydroxy-prefusarin hydrolase FUS2 [Lachnellula suecica]|uniref:20-hydroxy-prefusarin hydrolase FUS2 n=1 Tax=Lachnellula suecica TaxID=602035 RepID=A0A8T9C0B0_9HELO|nr:20-hydroxy-prefusarin hydrolase FUS2 [Lachnellula suecica]